MKLKDHAGGDSNVVEIPVNDVKDVAVTFDFLLVAVLWRRLIIHQLGESPVGRDDSFDFVAGFRALDFGKLNELIEFLWLLLQIKLLPSLVFMYQADVIDGFPVEGSISKFGVIKFFAHLSHNPFLLLINYSINCEQTQFIC